MNYEALDEALEYIEEGIFDRFKKKKEEKPNYIQRAKNFLEKPKTLGEDCEYIFGILSKKFNITNAKFLDIIKKNANNFKTQSINNSYDFTDYQQEEISSKFKNIESFIVVAYGPDDSYWYCKEKNIIFRTDYKRVYFEFDIKRFEGFLEDIDIDDEN